METELTVEDPEEQPPVSIMESAPGLVFHGLCAFVTVMLLIAASLPGYDFFLAAFACAFLLLFALVWVVRGLVYLVAVRRGHPVGSPWGFAVAPVAGVLVLVLLIAAVPLRIRFAMSRGDFDRAVATIDTAEEPDSSNTRQIGSYEISNVVSLEGGGILFYEAHGNFLDDAGFAYLPDGPASAPGNGSFENPQFTHLTGPWYTFTASW